MNGNVHRVLIDQGSFDDLMYFIGPSNPNKVFNTLLLSVSGVLR